MSTPDVTLEAVEAVLAGERKGGAFPPAIERDFEEGRRRRRSLRLAGSSLHAAIFYNLFLAVDWLLVRDVFATVAALHLLVVTPWMLLTARRLTKAPDTATRETLAAGAPILMIAQVLTVFALSRSPDVAHYPYLLVPVILYASIVQRLSYRSAAAISISALAGYVGCVAVKGDVALDAAVLASSLIAVTACIALSTNQTLAADERRSFLLALRDRLIHQRTAIEAATDALTGLANRHRLRARFHELWAGGPDAPQSVAVVMLDLDHFKAFNDHYGHLAGDACLRAVTACALAALRGPQDLAARYGGEELLLVLPEATLAEATALAERVRRSVEALAIPHETGGDARVVTASLGASAAPVAAASADDLVAAADAALYAAKAGGRNRVMPPPLRANPPNRRAAAAG